MTTLTDGQIKRLWVEGTIGINPFWTGLLNPCSYDVRLGNKFRVYDTQLQSAVSTVHTVPQMTLVTVEPGQTFDLPPGGFALAETRERVRLPASILARFEGKSTLGRYGLMTHVTAGFIDPGFTGTITLELHNVSPVTIKLQPWQRIGQLAFELLSTPVSLPYYDTGRYDRQSGPTPPKPLGVDRN